MNTTHVKALVTGANGYLAGWIIKSLISRGIHVHTTVRQLDDQKKYHHLLSLKNSNQIKFFEANLLDRNSFKDAIQGCSIVFHTASPVALNAKNPMKDLLEPAKIGTANILHQVNQTTSVKKVILTSSTAAMCGDNKDITSRLDNIITEQSWNHSATIHHNPYAFAKTEAEKHAWEIAAQQTQWKLISINPSVIMGPSLSNQKIPSGLTLLQNLGNGKFSKGCPSLGMGIVDVRDCAEAHIQAALSNTAHGRYIVSGHNTNLEEIIRLLWPSFGNQYPLPKKTLPKTLIWLIGPWLVQGLTRKYISKNMNYNWYADNQKGIKDLNIAYRGLSTTLRDSFQSCVDNNWISYPLG